MDVKQRRRIKWHYDTTPSCDRPVGCGALAWFYNRGEMDEFRHLGWDFGIWQDANILKRSWISQAFPWTWASRTACDRVFPLREVLWCQVFIMFYDRSFFHRPVQETSIIIIIIISIEVYFTDL